MRLALAAALLAALPGGAIAKERLGWSLAITNDSIGEFRDRWQSSSVQVGAVYGDAWNGRLPDRFGELLEFRFRTDIITPSNLDAPDPADRRHAGVLAFGLHSHAELSGFESRIGADLVVIGEQTGLLDLQTELHRILGFTIPRMDGFQIEDQIGIDVSGEIARTWIVGSNTIRPFVEAQAGSEDLIRAGFDIAFGAWDKDSLLLRSVVGGQRAPAVTGNRPEGLALSFGADVAWVDESVFLTPDLGAELTEVRGRVRIGGSYASDRYEVFYGLTWLSPEFEAQSEGQFVGTFQAKIRF